MINWPVIFNQYSGGEVGMDIKTIELGSVVWADNRFYAGQAEP